MDEDLIRVEVLTPLVTAEGVVASGQVVWLPAAEAALLASVGAVRLVKPEAASAPPATPTQEPPKSAESAPEDAAAAPPELAPPAARPRTPRKPGA